MNILESREDYLERILMLQKNGNRVRSIDIVKSMGYSKPSVSIAVKKLRESGMITVDDNGYIDLTEEGRIIAANVYEKHEVITSLLMRLGVSPETAEEDACKIEHELSEETFSAIKKHIEKH